MSHRASREGADDGARHDGPGKHYSSRDSRTEGYRKSSSHYDDSRHRRNVDVEALASSRRPDHEHSYHRAPATEDRMAIDDTKGHSNKSSHKHRDHEEIDEHHGHRSSHREGSRLRSKVTAEHQQEDPNEHSKHDRGDRHPRLSEEEPYGKHRTFRGRTDTYSQAEETAADVGQEPERWTHDKYHEHAVAPRRQQTGGFGADRGSRQRTEEAYPGSQRSGPRHFASGGRPDRGRGSFHQGPPQFPPSSRPFADSGFQQSNDSYQEAAEDADPTVVRRSGEFFQHDDRDTTQLRRGARLVQVDHGTRRYRFEGGHGPLPTEEFSRGYGRGGRGRFASRPRTWVSCCRFSVPCLLNRFEPYGGRPLRRGPDDQAAGPSGFERGMRPGYPKRDRSRSRSPMGKWKHDKFAELLSDDNKNNTDQQQDGLDTAADAMAVDM